MSNMCLVVTPAIEELASKIQQEYPEACQRNGFNNQMCAEWIGLYNNTNSKNPDNVPAMKSLVNFIEKLRNQEGKSFLFSNNSSIFAENLNTYEKENAEGLPLQRMDLANLAEIEGELKEAASIFEGGENSPSQSNERSSRETNEQKQRRLEKWAKENNLWVDSLSDVLEDNFGTPIEGGGEAVVYDAGKNVVKSISLDYYDGNPQAALDRILLHNYLFPDTQLTDIGFGRDSDGTFKILVSQPYIKGRAATRDEIIKYAKDRGFYTTDNNSYYFRNIRINDLNELNVIISNDGIPRIIDAELRFDNLAPTVLHEEIPVELLAEIADEEASITAYDSRESSDPDLNKKFGDKTDVSVSEMLNNLLASNTPFEGFVKALQENIGELGDIRIKLVPNSRPEIRGNAGGYSSLDNTIYINRNANYKGKDGKVDNTIIHEIIHAIVANSLSTPKHREELGKLFDEAKEKILKKYNVENFDELPEYLKKGRLYGLQNLDEFAAEFFTNSEFISELNDENIFGKRSSKKSLFSRLVEWIKSLLPKGVTETYKRSGKILNDIILNSGGSIQSRDKRNSLEKITINRSNNRLNKQIEYGNDFRRVQKAVRTSGKGVQSTSSDGHLSEDARQRLARVLRDELKSQHSTLLNRPRTDLTGKGNLFAIHKEVDPQLFHDVFEIARFYTTNGELVDLHDDYSNCKCYLNEDGTCGFAIEPDGNLISVFSLGTKRGFLWAIKDFAVAEGANHLDAYASEKQNLRNIYEKVFDAKVASSMDYNMEYDHDSIAENHGSPQVVFMVLGKAAEGKVIERHFNKDQYDDAEAYQHSFLPQTILASPQASQINPLFRQGVETLTGYYEGGGRLITDDFPGVPNELDDKLNNHFMGGEELSDDDYRELAKYISVVQNTDANTSQSWPYIAVPKQQTQPSSISSPSQAAQNTSQPNTRPQSDSFKTALKVTENRTTQFYQTFTPQQIKDRGVMISDYFSDIIDDYILDELDRVNRIIENPESSDKDKEDARTLKNLLRDPINGRQYAANKIQIGNILDEVKDKIRRKVNSYDGVEKQLWQNTLDFFDELFNNQASLEIEEQEGIRIIGLRTIEKSPDEVATEEENDGDDETGHTVSGNDGWLFQTRFENPASSLSKRVKRMTYNIRRSTSDKDDLGHARKYPSGQIYATLLSYLAKTMQNPDDFMQVIRPEEYDGIYDHYGNEVTDELYPYGYPTFPVLETMRSQYPWVEQIINRLTDDYLDKDWNTCIAFPSTYGAMASQFYTNFRKVFIPYAKIQVGDGKFGVTPLNTEMEARCQKDKLAANFNNGIVTTDTCIYNQDTTINREHADDLKDYINDVIEEGGVEHAYRLYQDLSDPDSVTEQEDVDDFNLFTDRVVFLLNSFGISSNRDNVVALLAQEEQGKTLLDMLKDLHYVADTISKVSDENAKNFNYFLDLHYVGGESVWGKFFDGRGMITDESYMQSFYDSSSKKTRYSYSADNYLQKTFRGLYNPDIDERKEFIKQNFMKYEWFYNHNTNTWRNKWLEHLYNAQDISDTLPYRNINNITEYGETTKVRDYRTWTLADVWLVQNRSFDSTKPYTFYLAPIFSDSPMSMTVKGPVLSNDEVLNALVGLVDQEMWRIKYVGEREAAIERGDVKAIANFDGKRGKEFCFIPELNSFTFENGETFLQRITRMKNGRAEDGSEVAYSKADFDNVERQALLSIMAQKADAYLAENRQQYDMENFNYDEFFRNYMNMVYANASIIQFSTIDLAFYKSDVDFQKRFKEVYAGGIQLNTNSRYGKKTENTVLLADDIITSPSYNAINEIIENNQNLSAKDKKQIMDTFTDINVADAQAIRSMHSFRSVMDMMGRWDERAQEALDNFEKGEWNKEDFDVIFQTIKPFVYTVIDRNDGMGGVIPVPQQHKNSEICALMMYNLITNNLDSPVYRALSRFMETKDSNGEYLVDMIQFESAGKVGNQGVVNINYNPNKVMEALENEEYNFIPDAPNTLENVDTNYKAIKKQMDKRLVDKKISQENYNKVMQSLRPTEDEIVDMLNQSVLINNADGSKEINPEVVHTIPFDNYYQAQPTPEHHIDAEATFGSQARNIAVADLPDDFQLTLNVAGDKKVTLKGRDAVVNFYYELLDENLIEDFFGDGKNKGGLKEVFASKENLMKAVTDIVRGNPKYGKDFVEALKLDSDGNFTISPNSPTMFTLMQELVTSLFKNRITRQKINGAALIQAAGIGLDEKLRLVKDSKGNIVGAQCLMPLTSKSFFEPFLEEQEVNGEKVKVLNPEKLTEAGLDKAVGYRIPTENKSSMLPLIITGFTPLQNGSAIILPAEITALAGSDFDVDKMFVMLSEFDPKELKRIEYNFDLSPKENGRKARNNMLIQMIYGILTSGAGNQSLLNPQGFDNIKAAAKLNKIITSPDLIEQLQTEYSDLDDLINHVLSLSTREKEDFIKEYSPAESPVYPQTFAHSHARNMAGSNQIGIYAIQGSMAAKYQMADISLKPNQQFLVNGRTIRNVDVSENGKRLKRVGEMIGASADNGKDPILSDAGSTNKTAPIIGYMLRLGLTHEEAVLIINQPVMEEYNFDANIMESKYRGIKRLPTRNVDTKTLMKAIISPSEISSEEQAAIDALCYRVLKQAKAMEGLTMISRADSPNGAMQNTFAKARVQQYMVELFNAQMKQDDFPFYPVKEVINNTTVDVSKGEDVVREELSKQPMAFLHAMYGLGVNSLNDLASPYFFMLSKKFDSDIVKPILYNQSSNSKEHLENLVNSIYLDYITYALSTSPLFGEEQNADGTQVSMKSKRDYYLNSFADDFAKTLQENSAIREQLGSILQRDGNRVVLKDVGSLAKGQKDAISRRFDALMALGEEGQKLAKDLLLYAYYDSGLNFSHSSYSTRLSTYFLSQFPAFREILQQLDTPLTEEQQKNFIHQFLITHKNAAYSVDNIINRETNVDEDTISVDMNDFKMNRRLVNTILSPDPRMTGVQPYPYISFDNYVYELDADAYDMNPSVAVYHKLEDYPTGDYRPIYNANKSLSQLAEEYNQTEPQQRPEEPSIDVDSNPDTAHNTGDENPDIDNDEDDFSEFSNLGSINDVESPGPVSKSQVYTNEGSSQYQTRPCKL